MFDLSHVFFPNMIDCCCYWRSVKDITLNSLAWKKFHRRKLKTYYKLIQERTMLLNVQLSGVQAIHEYSEKVNYQSVA